VPLAISQPDSPAAKAFVSAAERAAAQVSIASYNRSIDNRSRIAGASSCLGCFCGHSKFVCFSVPPKRSRDERETGRDGLLKLAERITQIAVGNDGADPVVDNYEHDAQTTCRVCNQVDEKSTVFVDTAALAPASAEETFAKGAQREAFDEPVRLG
jgi:hypothetical protein